MTGDEWLDIATNMKNLWGGSLTTRTTDTILQLVADVDYDLMVKVVDEAAASGVAFQPRIPELLRRAREKAPFDPASCTHTQGWAIVEDTAGGRVGVCRVCRTEERIFPHGTLLTASEQT